VAGDAGQIENEIAAGQTSGVIRAITRLDLRAAYAGSGRAILFARAPNPAGGDRRQSGLRGAAGQI